MDFMVKDLMISVLPLRASSVGNADWGNIAGCDAGCTPCSDCSKCTLVTPGGLWERYAEVSNPAQLALLKQQLRETLAAIEAREKVVN